MTYQLDDREIQRRPVDDLVPGRINALQGQVCAMCGAAVKEFRDRRSLEEYYISAMCQKCQDATFGEDW